MRVLNGRIVRYCDHEKVLLHFGPLEDAGQWTLSAMSADTVGTKKTWAAK